MIVADTNLLASLFLPAATTGVAEKVLRKAPVWCVPFLWRSEFRNILATGIRAGRFDLGFALEVLEAAERVVRGNEYGVPNQDVLRLAEKSGCSAYDCEFVALAEGLEVPLVTLDKQVLKAFPALAVAPERFVCQF